MLCRLGRVQLAQHGVQAKKAQQVTGTTMDSYVYVLLNAADGIIYLLSVDEPKIVAIMERVTFSSKPTPFVSAASEGGSVGLVLQACNRALLLACCMGPVDEVENNDFVQQPFEPRLSSGLIILRPSLPPAPSQALGSGEFDAGGFDGEE